MADSLLSNVFSKITTSLPSIKISNWTIKVKQERKLNPLNANSVSDFLDTLKQDIKWAQEQIAGFFQTTEPDMLDIAEFDSFISFNGNHNSDVVKNAIEGGTFRSVNKIKNPDKIIVELAKGGYRSGIEEVLTNLKKYQNSTTICTVITPFGSIRNLNLIGLEYSFTIENGSNLLIAKLTFQEIRYENYQNNQKKPKIPGMEKIEDMGRKALQYVKGTK